MNHCTFIDLEWYSKQCKLNSVYTYICMLKHIYFKFNGFCFCREIVMGCFHFQNDLNLWISSINITKIIVVGLLKREMANLRKQQSVAMTCGNHSIPQGLSHTRDKQRTEVNASYLFPVTGKDNAQVKIF